MKTYQDLLSVGELEKNRIQFVLDAINQHKQTAAYKTAETAQLYATGKNATISKYQKILYTLSGKAVPDNYTANHKCKSGFFKRFVTQETAFEIGNGVTFEKPETKERLGKNVDAVLYKAVKSALVQSVSFLFYNLDHLELYELTEFVPLMDEHDGTLKAGIRYWQIDAQKPLRATLFELDGYTEYIRETGAEMTVLNEKRPYKLNVSYSEADGEEIQSGENYPGFPVVPLYGNMEQQSELIGHREQIDCYDLIKSGFANDLDDASMIYWTLTNCGGMDDVDLAKFIERMKVVHASNVPNSDEGSKAEAHTIDVPYQSREAYLQILRDDLYKDFMALDVEKIAAGSVTATQIEAAYEPLNEKADELEMCLFDFFDRLLFVAGIEDTPSFDRSRISNQTEVTQMVLSAAEYLDDETILRKLPFLAADEIDGVLERKDAEETERYKLLEKENKQLKNQQPGEEGEE